MDDSSEKKQAHDLIDRLTPAQAGVAVHFLEGLLRESKARVAATGGEADRLQFRQGHAWFENEPER